MRPIYTIALVAAATLWPNDAALSAEVFKGMTKNALSPEMINRRNTEGGRLLRRVDYDKLDDDDFMDEERGFDLKNLASKLNPVAAAKRRAAHATKVKEALKKVGEYQSMIDTANRLVRDA
ncbi:RxLR effector protein [Phytophthora megakarya]|uniref:RxLR effector protein n=1 Tax=Phytophthora megakarya TaxID=4795 RepID=A0A225WN83_9STRA|nr:RxLR effector protein [Phytophthora megakarya]